MSSNTPVDIRYDILVDDDDAKNRGCLWSRLEGTVMKLPVINFIYLIFHPEPPKGSEDDPAGAVMSLLNTIALVSALLFTVAAAIPTAFSYDDLVAADKRYTKGGVFGCVPESNFYQHMSVILADHSLIAVYSLGTALLMSMIMLISIGDIDAKDPTTFRKWWWIQRYFVLLTFLTMGVGVIFCFLALSLVITVTFPNYYLEDQCANNTEGGGNPYVIAMGNNPMSFALLGSFVVLCPFLLAVIISSGYAQIPPSHSRPSQNKQSKNNDSATIFNPKLLDSVQELSKAIIQQQEAIIRQQEALNNLARALQVQQGSSLVMNPMFANVES